MHTFANELPASSSQSQYYYPNQPLVPNLSIISPQEMYREHWHHLQVSNSLLKAAAEKHYVWALTKATDSNYMKEKEMAVWEHELLLWCMMAWVAWGMKICCVVFCFLLVRVCVTDHFKFVKNLQTIAFRENTVPWSWQACCHFGHAAFSLHSRGTVLGVHRIANLGEPLGCPPTDV